MAGFAMRLFAYWTDTNCLARYPPRPMFPFLLKVLYVPVRMVFLTLALLGPLVRPRILEPLTSTPRSRMGLADFPTCP